MRSGGTSFVLEVRLSGLKGGQSFNTGSMSCQFYMQDLVTIILRFISTSSIYCSFISVMIERSFLGSYGVKRNLENFFKLSTPLISVPSNGIFTKW